MNIYKILFYWESFLSHYFEDREYVQQMCIINISISSALQANLRNDL